MHAHRAQDAASSRDGIAGNVAAAAVVSLRSSVCGGPAHPGSLQHHRRFRAQDRWKTLNIVIYAVLVSCTAQ